jgi:hypothetical protein
VNGQPAPPALLAFFGLPSGSPVSFTHSYLYHGKSFMPLLHFQHSDGAFGPVDNLYLIYDELGTAALETFASGIVLPYPNPCTDRLFVPMADSDGCLTLYDMKGREILSRKVTQPGLAELPIPQEVADGHYVLRISDGRVINVLIKK